VSSETVPVAAPEISAPGRRLSGGQKSLPQPTFKMGNRAPSPTRYEPLANPPSSVAQAVVTASSPPEKATSPRLARTPSPSRGVGRGGGRVAKKVEPPVDHSLVKCVVMGEGGVGKSCLTIRFMQNHFVEHYDPTIEDSYRKGVVLDFGDGHGDQSILLDILDTAGQECYSAMRDAYMQSGEGFLLVFDVTSRDSFDGLTEFYSSLLMAKDRDRVPIVIAGNKCDLDELRQVSTSEASARAENWGALYLETSAAEYINVVEAFESIVREVWKDRNERASVGSSSSDTSASGGSRLCSIL
jgi:GTPase KRas